MTKTVFVNGTIVQPEFLNAINNPTFVETPQFDGELPLLINDSLSNAPGQLKPEWTAFRDAFKVSPATGLSVTYLGGTVMLPDDSLVTLPPGALTLNDNATNWIWIDQTGAIAKGTQAPTVAFPIARVAMQGGQINGPVVDLRPRHRVFPRQIAVRLFGGWEGATNYALNSGSATFSESEYFFNDFTIGESAILNITYGTKINCAGRVTINGAIVVTPVVLSGSPAATWLTSATINPSSGSGLGRGQVNTGGSSYPSFTQAIGSGGASGGASGGGNFTVASGGGGGGAVLIDARGRINVGINGSISANGESSVPGVVFSGSAGLAGGGGGSGGLIQLQSLIEVVAAGTLSARGGNGSNAVGSSVPSVAAAGGGGGGGGRITIVAPTINLTGSNILLAGGAGGTALGGAVTSGGGGGFGGAGGGLVPITFAGAPGATGVLLLRNTLPG